MKIGIVTEYYYPYLGGIAEHVHYTYTHFRRKHHEVKILTPRMEGLRYRAADSPGWAPARDVIRVGTSYPFYSNGGFVRFTAPFGLADRLRRIFERERFDLIHVHAPLVPVLPIVGVNAALGPVVGTFHTVFKRSLAYRLARPYFEAVLRRIDGCLAVSPFSAASMRRYFDAEFTVIPNGVDTDVYSPEVAPVAALRRDRTLNIVFLGRFDPHNGLPSLLAAFAKVKRAYRDCRLVVVGDGPLARQYRQSLPADLKSAVVFAGMQYARKPNFLAAADVFVHPALMHNQSIVCLEAMASGVPIVAADIPAFRWVLEDDGVFFPPGDVDRLAGRILDLLGDRATRRDLAARVRRRALDYSWDGITTRLLEYYGRVLGAKDGRPTRLARPQWLARAGARHRGPRAASEEEAC